jgi:hypothetical protein
MNFFNFRFGSTQEYPPAQSSVFMNVRYVAEAVIQVREIHYLVWVVK